VANETAKEAAKEAATPALGRDPRPAEAAAAAGPGSSPALAAQQNSTSALARKADTLLVSTPAIAEPLSLRELEIRHIERLLREHKNITMVAKLLDIDRRTLQRKLRSLGIDWRDE
jgi:ActR/RegA family two-component response regulator